MSSVTFPGRYESLAKIGDWVREAAQHAGLDSFAVYAVETAVDEACSNIIEHAYGGEGIGDIDCSVEEISEGLLIRLHDNGQSFDPCCVPEPDIEGALEDRAGHGLGIYIMRQWMDEVHFEFSPTQGNTLTLLKRKAK